jgi:hypothetical protein
MTKTVDVELCNGGTVFLFRPVTKPAQEWFADNVESEPWQWSNGSLGVDHRYAEDLLDGIASAGFDVRWYSEAQWREQDRAIAAKESTP